MCPSQVGQGRENWCHCKALLDRGADQTKTKRTHIGVMNHMVMFNEYKTLCTPYSKPCQGNTFGRPCEATAA